MKKVNKLLVNFLLFFIVVACFNSGVHAAPPEVAGYILENGMRYKELDANTVEFCGYFDYPGNEEITIPSTVKGKKVIRIASHSFSYNPYRVVINISEGIKEIAAYGIYHLENLTTVRIPKTMESIDDKNFYECPKLTNLVIPSNLTHLKEGDYRIVDSVNISGTRSYDLAREAIAECNNYRKSKGLAELKIDNSLTEYAMERAVELSIYFAHERPNGCSLDFGENIAASTAFYSPRDVTIGWINSPGHRANMETASYKSIGIGCFFNEFGSYWIQVFSNEDSKNTYIKTGAERGTATIQVARKSKYYNIYINGLESTMNLSIGESIAPNYIKNTNNGWEALAAFYRPSDLKWTSSNTKVCTVDSNGKITGKGKGAALVTATIGTWSYTYHVYVGAYFRDVPADAWFYEPVNALTERGVIKGYSNTQFGPNDKLTRGQLVTILWRLEGEPSASKITSTFTDIGKSEYYTDAVKWANSKGIVTGYNSKSFGPWDNITRQDLAVILNRYAKFKGKTYTTTANLNAFKDRNKVGGYAETAVKWAVENGIISGNVLKDGSKTIAPIDNASRAEVATMLYRYLNKFN